ncbi:hypothetical protein [Musicola paradisiaca]|uniref:Uncharacterized protein n=1 Tax=Musicola paradisiaca (strain Ech703) TaxID=579405 RepID=C6CCK5_MUSP7|nr:hypothetical protein [Musicola paradisiaca]ACS86848.1 hypothetical protein Dd703_3077 [Musicola paradisiaca Ech703]
MSSNGFDPKDIEEICSRKKRKFRMKKADYKELGRNILQGSVDVAIGGLKATAIVASQLPTSSHSSEKTTNSLDGVIGGIRYRDGVQVDD